MATNMEHMQQPACTAQGIKPRGKNPRPPRLQVSRCVHGTSSNDEATEMENSCLGSGLGGGRHSSSTTFLQVSLVSEADRAHVLEGCASKGTVLATSRGHGYRNAKGHSH